MGQKLIKSNIILPFLEDSYRSGYTEYQQKNLRCSDAGVACDDGEKCERALFYNLTQSEDKSLLSSQSLVLFDDGRLHEEDIRRRLRVVLRSPEREVSDQQNGARGKIDNMVVFKTLKEMTYANEALSEIIKQYNLDEDPILEIKTVNEFMYQYMASNGKISQNYYDQVQYYMFLTKVKWAIVLIKNRNTTGDSPGKLPFLEFIVLSDRERQAQIRAGLNTVNDCVEKNVLPPRPFLRESTQCTYCRFKYVCWPKQEAEPIEVEKEGQAPSQEILESAMKLCAKLDDEIKAKEEQRNEAKQVIESYFKATGEKELSVANVRATYTVFPRSYIDAELLLEKVGVQTYLKVSAPSNQQLKQAISNRLIDANVLEQVKKPGPLTRMLRISQPKKAMGRLSKEEVKKQDRKLRKGTKNNGNKRNKRNKKTSKVGASKTGNKKNK